MRWLYRLENKLGRYYIRNLMTVIVGGMVIVWLADMFMAPGGMATVSSFLSLNSADVLRGQVWRLVTFVFVPPSGSSFLLLISLYFYYIIGRMMENYWGGFRLNVYYLFGMLGAIVGTFVAHFLLPLLYSEPGVSTFVVGDNYYLNLTLFLAIAVIAPDTEFRLFFILPVKVKWLALIDAILVLIPLLQAFIFSGLAFGLAELIFLLFSLINFLIFFGPTLTGKLRQHMLISKNRRQWRNRNR